MIAGGVGITPFRSLIRGAVRHPGKAPASIMVLYSDDTGEYAYKSELDRMATENDSIRVEYVTSQLLPARTTAAVGASGNAAAYYIADPAEMVAYLEEHAPRTLHWAIGGTPWRFAGSVLRRSPPPRPWATMSREE